VSTHIRHTERTEIDEAVSTTTLVDVLRRNAALHEKAPVTGGKETIGSS
jgi:hypothetical protein